MGMMTTTRRDALAGVAALAVACSTRPGQAQSAQAARIRARMARAAEDGLDPAHYAAPDDAVLLADAYGRFARDLAFGRVREMASRPDIVRAPAPEPSSLGGMLLAGGDPLAALDALAPSTPLYAALKAELTTLRAASWPTFEPGSTTLNPGTRDPRVAAIRARLAATDPELPASRDPDHYDPQLVAAAKRFQAAHALDADGKLGRFSQRLLAETPAERAARVAANMDMLRAPVAAAPELTITVNVPAYQFVAVEENRDVLAMKVVVGRPQRPTPLMQTRMVSAVFNPPWGVPQTLAREDMLPKLRADPASVTARGFRIFGAGGVEVDPTTVDWRTVRADHFPYVIRQDPGDGQDQVQPGEPLRHLYARHARPALFRDRRAGLQLRLHPAGTAARHVRPAVRRPVGHGPPAASGAAGPAHHQRHGRPPPDSGEHGLSHRRAGCGRQAGAARRYLRAGRDLCPRAGAARRGGARGLRPTVL
jgi:murein L,D-transpeptidase YcbB/YkuD